jgi:hypothetical protein
VTVAVLLLTLAGAAGFALLASHGIPLIDASQTALITRQCNDTADNDSDGKIDMADPDCVGPLDNSEASGTPPPGNPLCAVFNFCIRLVSHYDAGGTEVVREHEILPGIGQVENLSGRAIDATGDGVNDLAVAVGAPGSLIPLSVDLERPGVKIERMAGAPASFPVKLEAVIDEGSAPDRKLSIGYDTRGSTAPTRWIAKVDIRNRDGNPATEQKKVDLTINRGPSDNVALVSETFTAPAGLGESERSEREITRLTYRGDANGAHVPTTAGVDSTANETAGSQRLVLTRVEPTVVDFLLTNATENPKVTGTIARLPTSVDVTIADEDLNGDGEDDTKIDYGASAPVGMAQVGLSQIVPDPDEGDHRRSFDIEAAELPTTVHAGIASPSAEDNPAPKPGKMFLEASGRTASLQVTGVDERPFFSGNAEDANGEPKGANGIELRLDDVPRALDAGYGGGLVTMDAYATPERQQRDSVGTLEFRGQDVPGAEIPVPSCGTDSCDDGYDVLRDPERNGAISEDLPDHFLLFARLHNAKSASIATEPDPDPDPDADTTDIVIDTAPDLGPPGSACGEFPPPDCDARTESFRPVEALLKKERLDDDPATPPVTTIRAHIGALLPNTHFTQIDTGQSTPDDDTDNAGTISYSNDSTGNSITTLSVDAENLPGPVGENGQEADNLHVDLNGVPKSLEFSRGKGGFPLRLQAGGGPSLGSLDVVLRSDGAPDADLLPVDEDVDYNFTPANSADDEPRNLVGVRIRDFPDRHVIHARMRSLRDLTVDKKPDPGEPVEEAIPPCVSGDDLCIVIDGEVPGNHPRLRFDSQTKITQTFGELTLPGVESVFATLDQVPSSMQLRKFTPAEGDTRLSYSASEAVGTIEQSSRKGFELRQATNYINPVPDPILPNSDNELSLAPMPESLEICRSGATPICSEGAFGDRTDASEGSLRIEASPRARFRSFDQPNVQAQVFTNVAISAETFAMQADSEDAGYLAFDTGWNTTAVPVEGNPLLHTHDPPPADSDRASAFFQIVNGTRDITVFDFPEGFASDGRMIAWGSNATLFLADTTDITSLLDIDGHVECPSGTGIDLNRVGPGGIDVELNLGDEFCEP